MASAHSPLPENKMHTKDLIAPSVGKLFEAIELFQIDLGLNPKKEHFASHIKLLDFEFNKDFLISRLSETLISWVFTSQRANEIFNEALGPCKDIGAASTTLYRSAKETMRLSAPQGQFGELLLSAFLQHVFCAAPLLRKQLVRTSDSHERFGADAIHYSNENGHHLYVGESKCYKSKYKFPEAFESSLNSMVNTMSNLTSEIRKFSVGGFIEEDLQHVAKSLFESKLAATIHPVSIIIYNETKVRTAASEYDSLSEIKDALLAQCKKIAPSVYTKISPQILGRMTYIVMPVWGLDTLLDDFVKAL